MRETRDMISESENPVATAVDAEPPRKRVRTPGKHIVLFSLAVTFILAISTTALQTGSGVISSYALPAFTGRAGTVIFSPSEEYLVDLAPDAAGRAALLKLTTKIVAKDGAALAEIREKQPMIRERTAFFLRELSADDFSGSEAMARLKSELLKRAQLSLPADATTDLIVEDLVIQ